MFTKEGGKPLNEERRRRLLRMHEIAVALHGFRSSFRDCAAEETKCPREVVDGPRTHVVQNENETSDRCTGLFESRRRPMEGNANYFYEKPGQAGEPQHAPDCSRARRRNLFDISGPSA